MHFCENCGNMFYIELNKDDPDTLIYYCRNCGNKNDKLNNDSRKRFFFWLTHKSKPTIIYIRTGVWRFDPSVAKLFYSK